MTDHDRHDEQQLRRFEVFTALLDERREQHRREHELQERVLQEQLAQIGQQWRAAVDSLSRHLTDLAETRQLQHDMLVRQIAETSKQLDARLAAEAKRLEQLSAARVEADTEAQRLRSEQIEKRLTALNGEQGRLAVDRERYLPRELFEAFTKEIEAREDAWQKEAMIWRETQIKALSDLRETTMVSVAGLRETLNVALANTAGRDRGVSLSWSVILAIVGVAIGIIALIEKLLHA